MMKFGKKVLFVSFIAVLTIGISGCSEKKPVEEQVSEEERTTQAQVMTEATSEVDDLEAVGDIKVEKEIFDVNITVPKDFIGDVTQEELDKSCEEKGYKSVTLNDDGSATYVMTKSQHKELMVDIKKSIDDGLSKMIGSEDYPDITNIEVNEDYTEFTVTTNSKELSLSESFSVISFYMYGGMYGIFNGKEADNVSVKFVNAETGEVIDTANSSDAGE